MTHIMHVALGGCLKAPPVHYGLTSDTGGHIAYVWGAVFAQAECAGIDKITVVTRAFDDSELGPEYRVEQERISERISLCRLRTACMRYLTKEDLVAQLPALQRAFIQLVRRKRPDVLHAHFADAAELALAAKQRFQIPVLYTPHSLALDHGCRLTAAKSATGRALERRIAREYRAIEEADAIIVSSCDEAHHQLGSYGVAARDRTFVVHPGVSSTNGNDARSAMALVSPYLEYPEKPCLLAIARPVPKKNLTALLRVFAASHALQAQANLIIVAGQHAQIRAVGDEQSQQLETLQEEVRRHALHGKVALPPAHEPCDVPALYRLAARRRGIFVNIARHEPFGLTLIEAAYFGVPVVATCKGGPTDIIANVRHGFVVDPDKPAAVIAACRTLIESSETYDRAQRSALQRHSCYDWRGWALAVRSIIANLRKKAPPESVVVPLNIQESRTAATAKPADDRSSRPGACRRRLASREANLSGADRSNSAAAGSP